MSDIENRWHEFYLRQSREDQIMLVELISTKVNRQVEYATRKMRVAILRALGLNGFGECRHCPSPRFCEHGGITKGEECDNG